MKSYTITKEALDALLLKQRQDIRKGVCSAAEAMQILGLKSTAFYAVADNPKTLIRRSNVNGRYILSSVIREFERVHGVPYSEAIVNTKD